MTENPKQNPKRKFQVAQQMPQIVKPKDVNAAYSNMARIAHMPSELVFDFILKTPGASPAEVVARVLMSPLSAKLLHRALSDNLTKYENTFGEIKVPVDTSLKEYSKLFQPPGKPEAGDESTEEGEPQDE